MDIGLPDLDGYEVVRRARTLPHGPTLRLIALTGYGRTQDRTRALEAGFDEHLVKPVDIDVLTQLLHPAAAVQ